jgi:hypothetical protein
MGVVTAIPLFWSNKPNPAIPGKAAFFFRAKKKKVKNN